MSAKYRAWIYSSRNVGSTVNLMRRFPMLDQLATVLFGGLILWIACLIWSVAENDAKLWMLNRRIERREKQES